MPGEKSFLFLNFSSLNFKIKPLNEVSKTHFSANYEQSRATLWWGVGAQAL